MKYNQSWKQFSVLDPLVAGVQYFILKGDLGRFRLWYDPVLEKEYEEYSVNEFSSNNELDIYQFRRDQWHNLITINHLSEIDNMRFKQFKIFTQRIPIFLSELTILNLSQCLLILKQSLVGFQTIMQKYGFAHIEDRMIGINSEGKIKVWWNSKYEKNHAEIPIVTVNWLNSQRFQQQMVNSLFDSVEKHCERSEQFLSFQRNKPLNMSFIKSRDYIFDFMNQQTITLPQTLKYLIFPLCSLKIIQLDNNFLLSNFMDNPIQNARNQKQKILTNQSQSLIYVSTKIKSQPNQLLSSKHISKTPSFIYSKQGGFQSQQRMNSKRKTKYFKQDSNLSRRESLKSVSKSKDKINIKYSWTSKDLSFKSTTNSNQKKTIEKSLFEDKSLNTQQNKQLFQQSNNESFMIQSQYQFCPKTQPQRSRSQHYQLPIDQFPITKSVMINNNQYQKQIHLNPQNIMVQSERKPLQIETNFKLNRDFNVQNLPSILITTSKSKNLSSLTQFKSIKKSVIKDDQKKDIFNKNGLLAISQLKSSYFNKLDDIKRSIISQHINQNSQDVSSPLLIKTRSSSIRKGFMRNLSQNEEDILPVIISSQNLSEPIVYSSITKSTILREIMEADGQ